MTADLGLVSWRLPGAVERAAEMAAGAGARRLHVDHGGHDRDYELRAETLVRLRRSAQDAGVAVTAVAVNALNDVGVMSTGTTRRRTATDLVERAVEAAHSLGADALVVPAFRRNAMRTAADVAATGDFLVHTAELAGRAGLTLVHENVLQPLALEHLAGITAGSGVRFLLDIGNLHEHGVGWRPYLVAAGQALHPEVHVKDFLDPPAGAVPLGAGAVPLAEILADLLTSPRIEAFVLETDHRDGHLDDVRADLALLTHLTTHDDGTPR